MIDFKPTNPRPEPEERVVVNGKDVGRVYPCNADIRTEARQWSCQLAFTSCWEHVCTHGNGITRLDAIIAAIDSALSTAEKLKAEADALATAIMAEVEDNNV